MAKSKGNPAPENKLVGMKAICKHLGVSETTALKWHREYSMPIKKINGIWIATRSAIDGWYNSYCAAAG